MALKAWRTAGSALCASVGGGAELPRYAVDCAVAPFNGQQVVGAPGLARQQPLDEGHGVVEDGDEAHQPVLGADVRIGVADNLDGAARQVHVAFEDVAGFLDAAAEVG